MLEKLIDFLVEYKLGSDIDDEMVKKLHPIFNHSSEMAADFDLVYQGVTLRMGQSRGENHLRALAGQINAQYFLLMSRERSQFEVNLSQTRSIIQNARHVNHLRQSQEARELLRDQNAVLETTLRDIEQQIEAQRTTQQALEASISKLSEKKHRLEDNRKKVELESDWISGQIKLAKDRSMDAGKFDALLAYNLSLKERRDELKKSAAMQADEQAIAASPSETQKEKEDAEYDAFLDAIEKPANAVFKEVLKKLKENEHNKASQQANSDLIFEGLKTIMREISLQKAAFPNLPVDKFQTLWILCNIYETSAPEKSVCLTELFLDAIFPAASRQAIPLYKRFPEDRKTEMLERMINSSFIALSKFKGDDFIFDEVGYNKPDYMVEQLGRLFDAKLTRFVDSDYSAYNTLVRTFISRRGMAYYFSQRPESSTVAQVTKMKMN